MKKSISMLSLFFSCFLLFPFISVAQEKSETIRVNTKISISVHDISRIKTDVEQILNSDELTVEFYYTYQKNIDFNIRTDSTHYEAILTKLRNWGTVTKEVTIRNSFTQEITTLNENIRLLENEKRQYQEIVNRIDSSRKMEFVEYWEKIITLDREISIQKVKLADMEKASSWYFLEIKIREQEVVGNNDYGSSWINMPGIEMSLLSIEQPETGISPQSFTGYNLKYMFNYKKTYVNMGLYKSNEKCDSGEYNEIYMFSFGQDFYSKRLGRGQRKFFNLYTSFNTGMYIASGENIRSNSWFVNPFIGLELYKDRNFIIDNKVGYFVPFDDNRNLRGMLYNVSFNFIF